MLVRLLVGGGLLAVGYLLGKAVGRREALREELEQAQPLNAEAASEGDPDPSAVDSAQQSPD